MNYRPKIVIHQKALQHNLKIAQQAAPQSKTMAVIKANAYGHGLLHVAKTLKNADAFAVARVDEGIALRQAGIQQEIVILEGFNNLNERQATIKYHLTAVIHQPHQINLLTKIKSNPIHIWLKIDTGMHRLGFSEDEIIQQIKKLNGLKNIHIKGLLTHLADADNLIAQTTTNQQINQFKRVYQQINQANSLKSIANSAGILAYKKSHQTWNRAGIMLYGASPFMGKTGKDHQLKPAMTFSSRLIAIQSYKKGDKVGYAGTWQCPKDSIIGVVAVGYGDGYPRHAKNGVPVLIRNHYCPLVGRVSMDMISVDLSAITQPKIGDKAILWGKKLAVEIIAEQSETIAYELLCGITARVQRQ